MLRIWFICFYLIKRGERMFKRIILSILGIAMFPFILVFIGIYLLSTGQDFTGALYLKLWYIISGQWGKIE